MVLVLPHEVFGIAVGAEADGPVASSFIGGVVRL